MALQQFAAEQKKNANASTAPVGQPVVEIEIRDVVIQTGGEIIPTYEGEYEVTPQTARFAGCVRHVDTMSGICKEYGL